MPVKEFEGIYQISNKGKMRSKSLKVRKLSCDNNGYVNVSLYDNGFKYATKMHRLVAIHFIENVDNKPCINHKNGIKTDNRVENLEWCTYSENTNHAILTGLLKIKGGGQSHKAKLTDSQVTEIYEMLKKGLKSTYIESHFKISQAHVAKIKSGRYFKNIVKPEFPLSVLKKLSESDRFQITEKVKNGYPYLGLQKEYGICRKMLKKEFPR